MQDNESGPDRLTEERRSALAKGLGFTMPVESWILPDATLLAARWRYGAHHAELHQRSIHIIGRTYARHELFVNSGGPWRTLHPTPGAVTVMPARFEISWDIPIANDYSLVGVPDERLQACAGELSNGRRVELAECLAVDDAMTSQILALINHELVTSDRSSSLLLERAVDLLCAQLVRAHSDGRFAVPVARRGLAMWQVKRVTGYMQDRLEQDIRLADLAALVGLSRFHFCTAFRLATGCTLHDWLTAQRIERAKQLLGDPALRIIDIALAVGYATPSAFSASFRRRVGATPSAYRHRYGAEPAD